MKWTMTVVFASGYKHYSETSETVKVLEEKRDELLENGHETAGGNVRRFYPAHSITEVKIVYIP